MNKILIVEDEASICKALIMGLASNDFEVDVAPDGNGGILMGNSKEYDILISDLCLPDMDGLQVIRELKRISPEIISIIITGNGSMESSLEAIRLEVNDYLEKPLSLKTLKNSIRHALEKRSQHREAMRKKIRKMLELYTSEHSEVVWVNMEDRNSTSDKLALKLSIIVHQIGNHLMCINGSTQMAMFDLKNEEAIKQYLYDIILDTGKIVPLNKEMVKLGQTHPSKIEGAGLGLCCQEYGGKT